MLLLPELNIMSSKPYTNDLQVLLNHFTTCLKDAPSVKQTATNDSGIPSFFKTLLPNQSFEESDLFLLIGTLIPHFAPPSLPER